MADLVVFIRQLATSLGAGLTAEHALTLQSSHMTGPMKARLVAAAATVRRGRPLAEALAPMGLRSEDVALIRMGEDSGRLGELLHELAAELEADRQFRSELLGGLIYPGFLLVIGPVIGALPALVLHGAGAFVAAALPALLLSGLIVGGVIGLMRQPVGRRLAFQLPLLGGLLRKLRLRRFAVSLALASRAGIALAPALLQLGAASDEPRVKQAAILASRLADQGQPLSTAFARYPDLFPSMFMQLLSTGEAAGQVDGMLLKFAEYLEGEIAQARKLVTRALGVVALMLALGMMASRILASVGDMYRQLQP